jgi:hypothetical protein
MSGWWRVLFWLVFAVVPGGLPMLLAWAAVKTLRARWQQARQAGEPVSLRTVLATVELKDLMREARGARQVAG